MRARLIGIVTLIALLAAACGGAEEATSALPAGDPSFGEGEAGGATSSSSGVASDAVDAAPPVGARAAAEENPLAPEADGVSVLAQVTSRAEIRTASVQLRTPNDSSVGEVARRASRVAEGLSGYVEQMSIEGGAGRDGHALVMLRVPAASFQRALDELGELGEVLAQSVGTQDVSAQLIDLDARLRSLRAQEQRLLELLAGAQDLDQVLLLEGELARVRTTIEQLAGEQQFLEEQVALSTITVEVLNSAASSTPAPRAALALRAGNIDRQVARLRDAVAQAGGEIDDLSLEQDDDGDRASITLRVPRAEFDSMLGLAEDLGSVTEKSVRNPQAAGDEGGSQPDAVLQIAIEESSSRWLVVVAGIVGLLLATAAGAGGAWRWRRRRAGSGRALSPGAPQGNPEPEPPA